MQHNKHDDSDELALMALRARLGYGPAKDPKTFMDAILAEQRHTTLVNIAIPTVLHQYFKIESKRLGLTEEE